MWSHKEHSCVHTQPPGGPWTCSCGVTNLQIACHRTPDPEIDGFPSIGVLDYARQCSRMLSSSALVQHPATVS